MYGIHSAITARDVSQHGAACWTGGCTPVEEDNSHTLSELPQLAKLLEKAVVLHHLLLDSLQRQQLMLTCKTAVIILLSPCGAEWSQVLLHGLPW